MTDQPEGGSGVGTPMSERMQSLLSRAMEDQASEQRQIQGLLAELRTLLGRLPGEVSSAVAERGSDDKVVARVEELSSHLAQLGQHIAVLARAVEARPTDETGSMAVVNAVQAGNDNLLTRLDPISQRLDAISARLAEQPTAQAAPPAETARVTAMERRLDEVSAALNDTHRRVIGLDNALGNLPEDVRELGDRMDSRVSARLGALDEIAAALTELRGVQGDSSIGGELAGLRSAVDELASRPTLAEDRETIVLAIRQLLGETVRAALADSEQQLRGHVQEGVRAGSAELEQRLLQEMGQSLHEFAGETERLVRETLEQTLKSANGDSDAVLREHLEETVKATAAESERAIREHLDETVKATTAESEQRVLEHVDSAVIALAEALLRKRSRSLRDTGPVAPPVGGEAAVTPAGEPTGPAAGTSDVAVTPDEPADFDRVPPPHPALEPDDETDLTVDEPPIGLPREESDTGRRKRGWFRSGK